MKQFLIFIIAISVSLNGEAMNILPAPLNKDVLTQYELIASGTLAKVEQVETNDALNKRLTFKVSKAWKGASKGQSVTLFTEDFDRRPWRVGDKEMTVFATKQEGKYRVSYQPYMGPAAPYEGEDEALGAIVNREGYDKLHLEPLLDYFMSQDGVCRKEHKEHKE